jgi:hypothetical protein
VRAVALDAGNEFNLSTSNADVVYHHHLYTSSSGRPVGCMRTLFKQHLNTHKQQFRTLGLQIIIHHTHAPVHKQSHRLTITTTHQGTDVSERQG